MRPAAVEWERAAEVRGAAEGWRRAGAIDAATAARIHRVYPDPGETPPTAWRVLTAGVVSAIAVCLVGALALMLDASDAGLRVLLLAFGGGLAIATERMEASPRTARRGAAGATAFWSVALLLGALGLALADRFRLDDALDWFLAAATVAWALACWRWGSPLFAALSAVALFALLARFSYGRALWIGAGAALVALAAAHLDRASWAPSHRRGAAVLVVAGLAGLYAAVNLYSLDQRMIEPLRRSGASFQPLPPALMLASALATLVIPIAVLWWGLRARRTLLVDAGIALAVLSALTLRHYVHVAPLWIVLAAGGAVLIGLAIAVERTLRRAPRGEIAGLTADPLFSDERRALALQAVPAVAALTPAGSAPPAEKGVAGGGAFGGGGASERF